MSWLSQTNNLWLWSGVLSALITWLAIRYARFANVIDHPGQRRSHVVPTPRGGGIGIVVCAVLSLVALPHWDANASPQWRLAVAVAMLALIGWIDDHRALPAWLRFLVQLGAVGIWLAPLLARAFGFGGPERLDMQRDELLGLGLLLAFLALWSINLHNFMDGINGLLGLQAIFVLGVLAWFGQRDPATASPRLAGIWAAAVAGFMPFNFPRARVFMGDVGSGAIGLLVLAAIAWQTASFQIAAATGVIAVSSFLTDATCTLLSRMLSGRRWYSAHREHLYQWMARTGMSHARVVAWYMGWNLLIVAPVLWWINRIPPLSPMALPQPLGSGVAWAVGVYVLGAALWLGGKRWCLARVRSRQAQMHRAGGAHAAA